MLPSFQIDPRPGGKISAEDLARIQELCYILVNSTATTPIHLDVTPSGLHFWLDTELGDVSTINITNELNIDGGTFNITNTTVNSYRSIWYFDPFSVINIYGPWNFYVNPIFHNKRDFDVATSACFTIFTELFTGSAAVPISTASFTTVLLADITLVKGDTVIIMATLEIQGAGTAVAGDVIEGQVVVDGTPRSLLIYRTMATSTAAETAGRNYSVYLDAGEHIVLLKSRRASGSGTCQVGGDLLFHSDGILTVQKQLLGLPTFIHADGPVCTDNPTDCCSGSGSGSDPKTVDTPCGAGIKKTLHYSIVCKDCPCLDGTSGTMTYTEGSCDTVGGCTWIDVSGVATECGGGAVQYSLGCKPAGWRLSSASTNCLQQTDYTFRDADSLTLSPFMAQWDNIDVVCGGCGAGLKASLIITE